MLGELLLCVIFGGAGYLLGVHSTYRETGKRFDLMIHSYEMKIAEKDLAIKDAFDEPKFDTEALTEQIERFNQLLRALRTIREVKTAIER